MWKVRMSGHNVAKQQLWWRSNDLEQCVCSSLILGAGAVAILCRSQAETIQLSHRSCTIKHARSSMRSPQCQRCVRERYRVLRHLL